MEKFNLEDALKGCPVVTRNNKEVIGLRIQQDLPVDDAEYLLGYIIKDSQSDAEGVGFYKNGRFRSNENSPEDLFLDKENWKKPFRPHTMRVWDGEDKTSSQDEFVYANFTDKNNPLNHAVEKPICVIDGAGRYRYFDHCEELSERKSMTLLQIEKELGYKISIA